VQLDAHHGVANSLIARRHHNVLRRHPTSSPPHHTFDSSIPSRMDVIEVADLGCSLHETQTTAYAVTNPVKADSPPETDGSAVAEMWLHATFEQRMNDLPGAFSVGGGPMKMATFAGDIDLAVTGAATSVVVRLAALEKGLEASVGVKESPDFKDEDSSRNTIRVAIPLPKASAPDNDDVVHIARTSTLLASHNVGALSTTGTGGESNAGAASALLIPALRNGSATLDLSYGRWGAIQHVVVLSRLEVRNGPDERGRRFRWKAAKDVQNNRVAISGVGVGVVEGLPVKRRSIEYMRDLSPKITAHAFIQYISDIGTARTNRFVYPSLPGLTKSFAMVPVMGYTTVDAMLHVPSGLNADGLEALMDSMVRIALQDDDELRAQMLAETVAPPATPGDNSAWREVAAQAVHLAIRFAVEYREDGIVHQESSGALGFAPLESVLGQATRSFFKELNDCDGSALLAMRIARHIGLSPYGDDRWRGDGTFVSYDSAYSDRLHPWTRAVRNALSHTDSILFTIVGASTGEGADAANSSSGTGTSNTGGHAVPIFVPTISIVRSLAYGLKGVSDAHGAPKFDDDEQERLGRAYARVMYPVGKLRGAGWISEEDVSADAVLQVREKLVGSDIPAPMAIDGTVTSAMDLHVEGDRASRRISLWRSTLSAFQTLGPTIADRVVDLTVGGPRQTHGFYRHFVEAAVVGSISEDTELVEAGVAAPHFVFARRYNVDSWSTSAPSGNERMDVGASPADLQRGGFALIPIVGLSPVQSAATTAMRHMLSTYSLPPRPPGLNTASAASIGNVNRSLAVIQELDSILEQRSEEYEEKEVSLLESDGVFLEMYLTPRAIWNNPNGVEHFANRVKEVALRGRATIVDLRGVEDAAFAVSVGIYV
jgi:hypothetical protein